MPEGNDKPQLDGALFVGDLEDDARDIEATAGGTPGDGKAEDALEALEGLITRMGLEANLEIREDGQRVVLDVDGPDAGRLIGKKGQTLDALQFLVNKMVNRFPQGRRHVIVDSGDYRERHDNGLVSMAHREAKRAVQQGRVITLKPMTARDRRVIHLSLAKITGVSTRSNGEGMNRRIQIIPANQSRGGGGGGGGGRRPRRRRNEGRSDDRREGRSDDRRDDRR